MFMWIAHALIHACWFSSVISSHLRETMSYLMSSCHHHTILYPHHSDGSMAKMISIDDDEEPI